MGFEDHSTTSCLMKLKDDIINAMNKGEITISVFADYSKAFNTKRTCANAYIIKRLTMEISSLIRYLKLFHLVCKKL